MPREISDTALVNRYLRKIGRRGGQSRKRKLTAAERSEQSRRGAEIRWNKDGRCRTQVKGARCKLDAGHEGAPRTCVLT